MRHQHGHLFLVRDRLGAQLLDQCRQLGEPGIGASLRLACSLQLARARVAGGDKLIAARCELALQIFALPFQPVDLGMQLGARPLRLFELLGLLGERRALGGAGGLKLGNHSFLLDKLCAQKRRRLTQPVAFGLQGAVPGARGVHAVVPLAI